MGLSYCESCKKMYMSSLCPSCRSSSVHIPVEVSIVKYNQNRKTSKPKEPESMWVGPIKKLCNLCKNIDSFYWILPPPSADEPPVIRYKCTKCDNTTSDYKN